jgi:hypothetical protein
MLAVAAGTLDEEELARWFLDHAVQATTQT